MSLPPDHHMHSPLYRHAHGEPEEYARHALATGLTGIGLSEHSPMMWDDFDAWRMRPDQLDEYVERIRGVQPDFPQITTRLGLEVDSLSDHDDRIRDLAPRHPWDYLIGSVHDLPGNWAVDHQAGQYLALVACAASPRAVSSQTPPFVPPPSRILRDENSLYWLCLPKKADPKCMTKDTAP